MKKPFDFFREAGIRSLSKQDERTFYLGSIAIRNDGAIVHAINGSSMAPNPLAHSERRLSRKLDSGAIVYVARMRANGDFAIAKPCEYCMLALKSKRVKRVYWTTGPNDFDWMDLN